MLPQRCAKCCAQKTGALLTWKLDGRPDLGLGSVGQAGSSGRRGGGVGKLAAAAYQLCARMRSRACLKHMAGTAPRWQQRSFGAGRCGGPPLQARLQPLAPC